MFGPDNNKIIKTVKVVVRQDKIIHQIQELTRAKNMILNNNYLETKQNNTNIKSKYKKILLLFNKRKELINILFTFFFCCVCYLLFAVTLNCMNPKRYGRFLPSFFNFLIHNKQPIWVIMQSYQDWCVML